ncbi:sigma factor-like helix-turn-helix DNA-binding protein [Companilactobacillus sp. DQM5]|uniref:sigma factor-like helix-turn-helix DNA-binding protein n=1 Tax=Companilactobacillus sp. DQM5 TaxID=3463359 RepID=UPI00405800E9
MSLFIDERTISELFPDRKNQLIRDIFNSQNIYKVKDITNDSISKVINARGFGDKKRNEFLQEINQLKTSANISIIFPEIISTNEIIKDAFLNIPVSNSGISAINGLIFERVNDVIKKSGYKLTTTRRHKLVDEFIDEVHDFLSSDLNKIEITPFSLYRAMEAIQVPYTRFFLQNYELKFKKLSDIIKKHKSKLDKYQLSIVSQLIYRTRLLNETNIDKTIFKDVSNQDKNYSHSMNILEARVQNKETLQEIGDRLGVTRERVRQIEKKIRDRFVISAKENLFFEAIDLTYFDIKINTILVSHLSESTQKILDYTQDNNRYNSQIGLYGNLKNFDLDRLIDKLLQYIDQNFGNKLSEVLIKMNSFFEEMDINLSNEDLVEVFNKIVKITNKIIINNDNIYSKLTKKQLVLVALEKYLQNNDYFELSLKNLDQLNKITQQLYASDIYEVSEDNYRALESTLLRITDDKILIRIGRRKYKIYNEENYSDDFLNDVKLFLIERLNVVPEVSYKVISQKYSKELKEQSITEFEIYYALKNKFSEIFDFGRYNTMSIRKKNSQKKSTEQVLLDVLNDNNGQLTMTDTQEKLGWDEYTIRQAAANSYEMYISDSVIKAITKKDTLKVTNTCKEIVKKNSDIIIVADEVKKYHIKNKILLSNYIQKNSSYTGNNLILIKSRQENVSPLYLILVAINDKFKGSSFTKDELMNYLYYIGYKAVSAAFNFEKLLHAEDIIEIKENLYEVNTLRLSR